MAQMADEPLSQLGRRICGLFTALEATTDHLDLSSLEIIDLAQRFDLWSLNLGLYQDGHESLDYRFRDAPATCRFARFLLAELERNLQLSMCFRIINLMIPRHRLYRWVVEGECQVTSTPSNVLHRYLEYQC